MALPTVTIRPGAQRRVLGGHPWFYSNELVMDQAAKALVAGTQVRFQTSDGKTIASGFFNPHSLIAGRVLLRHEARQLGVDDLVARIRQAQNLRDRLIGRPHYRLIHAEADGLPGLIVDRFGDVLTVQANSAGMDRLMPDILAALENTVAPKAIIVRNDTAARLQENLPQEERRIIGNLPGPIITEEYEARFPLDLMGGQKTGWFFDQRDNRLMVARQARDAEMLDLYCYMGGFAIQAARAGARHVTAIDRSEPALTQAAAASQLNDVSSRLTAERADIFPWAEAAITAGKQFDIVVADPPAFVKSRKDLQAGARDYRKLAGLCGRLVRPSGFLFIASCSHNMETAHFTDMVARGLNDSSRQARILAQTGAAPDHPVHPFLPESAYLKALWLVLD